MRIEETKKRATLLKKRKIAIVAALLVFALLLGAYAVLAKFMKPSIGYSDTDGSVYYIKYRGGEYAMYNENGDVLPKDEKYGYYITEIGSLISVDPETGETKDQIIVDDPEGGESLSNSATSTNIRLLMFPHVETGEILKLEVSNAEGKYSIIRVDDEGHITADGSLLIKDAPYAYFDPDRIPMIYSGAGYTVATQRVENPIKDKNGEYSEYGLVSEIRLDDDGKAYQYDPAGYTLTTVDGTVHKVILGDMLVSGEGFYAQYVKVNSDGSEVKRDTVYVLQPTTTQHLYCPIEDYVHGTLTYPMDINNYFDVENFIVAKRENGEFKQKVEFSYVDIAERENTVNALFPYVFGSELDGYYPSSDVIDALLQTLYEPNVIKVEKIIPSGKNYFKTLAEYGFYTEIQNNNGEPDYKISSDYFMSFDFDVRDDEENIIDTINNSILINKNENGNYYAYTTVNEIKGEGDDREIEFMYSYDLIIELDSTQFAFLDYDSYKWISRDFFAINIAFCEELTFTSKDYSAVFKLDNSASDVSKSLSDKLSVSGTDSKGNSINTFGVLSFKDTSGYDWIITPTAVEVRLNGTLQNIVSGYYAKNSMGEQAKCFDGYIPAADGSKVYVTPDTVKINRPDGSVTEYVRYETNNFRKLFQTLTNATIVDSYDMTEEEEAELILDPDKHILTMTMTDSEGTTTTYEFYSLTARKAYIRINGNGGFYVLPGRVEKFLSDTEKFFNGEIIDFLAKT